MKQSIIANIIPGAQFGTVIEKQLNHFFRAANGCCGQQGMPTIAIATAVNQGWPLRQYCLS